MDARTRSTFLQRKSAAVTNRDNRRTETETMKLNPIDWIIMLVYFTFVLGVGWTLKRHLKTSKDFFLSGRSLPAWITGLAFISANLAATEILGMAANSAQYGAYTVH